MESSSSTWKIGDPIAVEPLIQTLNDRSPAVRRNIIISLGNLGDEKAFDFILKSMNDEDWHVRKYAAVTLGKIGNERAIKPLLKHWMIMMMMFG